MTGLTRLLLVRHGEHDPRGRFLQHECRGLTDRGRAQAQRLAGDLAGAGLRVDAVVTSRAARAIETASALAERLGCDLSEPTCDLCEMHPGQAEGLTYDEMLDRYGPTYADVPGAEHWPDWLPRAVRTLRRFAAEHHGETIIAVTHTAVIKASFLAYGQMPAATAETVAVANAGVTEWTQPTADDDPRCHVWSLRRHG